MANILQQWVSEQLETTIAWEPEGFGIVMKDGTIVAAVLKNHKVITENQKDLILKTDVNDDIKNNWKHLLAWMKTIDIVFGESDLDLLCDGNCSTHLRLIHQLFLNLDKRERLDFINSQMLKTSPLVQQTTEESRVGHHFAKPFIRDLNFIEWQKKKAEELSVIYDHVRRKYVKIVEDVKNNKYSFEWPKIAIEQSNSEKKDLNYFQTKDSYKYKNHTYNSLIKINKELKGKENESLDSDWAKSYMENLQEKIKNTSETEKLQDQIRNVIETTVFENVLDEMEFEASQELAKKVMKLSQFEKDMCNKLLETKQLARRLIRDRAAASKTYAERREVEFQEYMDELRDQILDEMDELNIENRRQAELHERLFSEQHSKKLKLVYNFCSETVSDLIDFAIKVADLKENSCICNLDDEVLQFYIDNWKQMFYKSEQLFKSPEYDEDAMLEHIINLKEDSNILNEKDFIEYHTKDGPWTLQNLLPDYDDTETFDLSQRGERILGYIVYQCLSIKYPPALPKMPPNLPYYKVASIMLDIPSLSMIESIQNLIKYRNIHVVQLEAALSYCLRAYKNETIDTTGEIYLELRSYVTHFEGEEMSQINSLEEYLKLERLEKVDENNMHHVEIKINAEDFAKKTKISNDSVMEPNLEQNPTSKTILESDITLTTVAKLGKHTYSALRSGEALSDQLLVLIIIEYLKSLADIHGFVLVGYPVTWKQMKILEEELTGTNIPKKYLEYLLDTEMFEDTDFDLYDIGNNQNSAQLWKSRLIDDPRNGPLNEFSTYFTSYIKLKQTTDILSEGNIWDITSESSTVPDRVYAEQGINYSIYYEKIGKDLLVQICKFIIGEFSLPELDDDNLFGEGVLTNLEFPVNEGKKVMGRKMKQIEKKIKDPKKSRKEHASKVTEQKSQMEIEKKGVDVLTSSKFPVNVGKKVTGKKIKDIEKERKQSEESKKGNVLGEKKQKTQTEIEKSDDSVELLVENLDTVLDEKMVSKESVTAPIPGDEHWIFAAPPQFATNEPHIALATLWENIEKSYIESMEQLLYVRRTQFSYLVLYGGYVCDQIKIVLSNSSHSFKKQELVSNYSSNYNASEIDQCSDPAIRNDWFHQLDSVRTHLYNICDENKVEGEKQRCKLMENNWTFEELKMLTNTYVSAMSAEVNRTIVTLQMEHDFYLMIVKNIPVSKEVANATGAPDAIKIKSQSEDGLISKLESLTLNAFVDSNSLDEVYENYKEIIHRNILIYSKHIEKVGNTHMEVLKKHENAIQKPDKKKKNVKTPKKQQAVNKDLDKSMLQRIFDEWSVVMTAETNRCQLRLKMLMSKAILDIQTFTACMGNIFKEVDKQINLRYVREVECVDRLHNVLETALQKSKPIIGTIILEQDQLIIEDSLLQYLAEPATPPDLSTREEVFGYFKINQLAELCSKLKSIGPQGHMKQFSFTYVIQDWILNGKEEVNGVIPDIWMKLKVEEVPKIVSLVFGDAAAFIDWRDFLIYCTDVKFPNFDEILEVRMSFIDLDIDHEGSITREEFLNVSFWFEHFKKPELPVLESCLLKHFFCDLFECAKDRIDYTAFLLAFCKDELPEIGFAKAIGLSVGKEVCYDSDVCEAVILELIVKKKRFEEERAKNKEFANLYMDHIFENVINTCEGLILTEVTEAGQLVRSSAVSVSTYADNIKKSTTSFDSNSSQQKSNRMVNPEISSKMNINEKTRVKPQLETKSNISMELFNPNFVYSVCPYVFWNILKITLPYYFQMHKCSKKLYIQKYKRAINELKNDTANGEICVTRFLYHEFMQKLFHSNYKFRSCSIHQIVESVITSGK